MINMSCQGTTRNDSAVLNIQAKEVFRYAYAIPSVRTWGSVFSIWAALNLRTILQWSSP